MTLPKQDKEQYKVITALKIISFKFKEWIKSKKKAILNLRRHRERRKNRI